MVRIAIPRRGRAIAVLQLAYNRDHLPGTKSQNQLEEAALSAVIAMLPPHVRPVILADRGFARASFLQWLHAHHLDYVVRLDNGTCLTERDGRRWKVGEEGLQFGPCRWVPYVRYALYHGRARELKINVALYWQDTAGEPWLSVPRQLDAPASAAKAGCCVRDRGVSANHAATRMKLIAAARSRCIRRVSPSPM